MSAELHEATSLPIPTGTWVLDPAHSTVEFSIRHLGISKVRGRFHEFTAQVEVGSDLRSTSLSASVDLSSIDTNNADRDAHLRTTDFFDLAVHPQMTFNSTSLTGRGGDTYIVVGDLAINGHTRPIELMVEFAGTAEYPMDGSRHAGFSATGQLSRKDFGIEFNVPMAAGGFVIGNTVMIEIDVQLRQA